MAQMFQDNARRSLTSPLSKEEALDVLARNRFDLIEITDQNVFLEEIAAYIKTYIDAGVVLDA